MICLAAAASCTPPTPDARRLDRAYGFASFVLGDSLYSSVIGEAERTARVYDVIEFETFGRRFADQMPYPTPGAQTVYGVPVAGVFAGVIDGNVYAFLIQLEGSAEAQAAVRDSIVAAYGPPRSSTDTTLANADFRIELRQDLWEGDRVGMAYGRGEGYGELLVYDREDRRRRLDVQRAIAHARDVRADAVTTLAEVGTVRLDLTEPVAQWRYRFRRDDAGELQGASGTIDYSYVQPFFGIRGRSLYGLDMAAARLRFQPYTDSLETVEVRFDNTEGRAVGFMEMLRILEERFGPHAYSDTLHTRKGPFKRAIWYGEGRTVTLEEDRLRPEPAPLADVVVRFDAARAPAEPRPGWRRSTAPGASSVRDTLLPPQGPNTPVDP